jgi:hypothetical protein
LRYDETPSVLNALRRNALNFHFHIAMGSFCGIGIHAERDGFGRFCIKCLPDCMGK